MIEPLEPRQLLAGHFSTQFGPALARASFGGEFAAFVAAAQARTFSQPIGSWHAPDTFLPGQAQLQNTASVGATAVCTSDTNSSTTSAATTATLTVVSTTAQTTSTPVAKPTSAVGQVSNTTSSASALVTRLPSGSDFSGYIYIPSDGSSPPPLTNVANSGSGQTFEFPPGGGLIYTGAPRIKPSDRISTAASQSSQALTPLAQTPSATPVAAVLGAGGLSRSPAVPSPVTVPAPFASGTSLPATLPHTPIYLAPLAMVDPGSTVLTMASVPTEQAAQGLAIASNKAADALSLIASPEGLADVASYNFVHFNPALLLNDAIAAFSEESAMLSFVPAPTHSTARAWTITAGVIGFDLMLMGYCYHRSRRQKAMALAALAAQARNPR